MPEFNLGHTFNYAEMAALIAPRPFMVERGHDDGVGIDEWMAYEYAKVRRLYSRLKIPERTEIEFFAGRPRDPRPGYVSVFAKTLELAEVRTNGLAGRLKVQSASVRLSLGCSNFR